MKRIKAFTLLEVIVVIGVIGILLAIAIPNFNKVSAEAHMKKLQAEAIAVESAASTYKMVYGSLPVEGNMTKSEVLDIADRVYDTDGNQTALSDEGTYSDIDDTEIREFVDLNVDPKNFIIDPSTGETYFLDPVTNKRVVDNSPVVNMSEVTHADMNNLKSEVLLKDGTTRLNTGYTPEANYDIATKGYTDEVRSEILFEVNKPLEEVTNWDAAVVPGRYHSAASVTNAPISDAGYDWYGVVSDSNGFITQTLRDQENRKTFSRTKDGANAWTEWNQVLDSSDYEELFQFVVDGKNNLETAILDKDGTVSKEGIVPSFAELQHGIETIPTYGTSTMMPLYRYGVIYEPLTSLQVGINEEVRTILGKVISTHSWANINADNLEVFGDSREYTYTFGRYPNKVTNTASMEGESWIVSEEKIDVTDFNYICFDVDPITPYGRLGISSSKDDGSFVKSAQMTKNWTGGASPLMDRHIETIDISDFTGEYYIKIQGKGVAGSNFYNSDSQTIVYAFWLQKDMAP